MRGARRGKTRKKRAQTPGASAGKAEGNISIVNKEGEKVRIRENLFHRATFDVGKTPRIGVRGSLLQTKQQATYSHPRSISGDSPPGGEPGSSYYARQGKLQVRERREVTVEARETSRDVPGDRGRFALEKAGSVWLGWQYSFSAKRSNATHQPSRRHSFSAILGCAGDDRYRALSTGAK